jgi:hypothetical protein
MKLTLVALVALFSSSAFAAELSFLDCLATNGVTIQGESKRGEALRVETHWGFLRKDFIAAETAGPRSENTYIALQGPGSVEYILDLKPGKTKRGAEQQMVGSILRSSGGLGDLVPAYVAGVSCKVRFR